MIPTILGFLRKEFRQALRDPKMRALLLVAPIIQMTIFGLALVSEVKHISFFTQVAMNDPLLEEIQRDAIASGWFDASQDDPQIASDPVDAMRANRTELVLAAPPGGVTSSTARGEGRVQALIDSVNLIRARSLEFYLSAIVAKVLQQNVSTPKPPLISMSSRVLYNPTMETAYYLVPGVMCMLICIITISLTSMSIAKEKEMGTFETIIATPVATTEVMIGKTFPFIIIGGLNVPLIMAIAILGFHVPMRGSYLVLTACTIFFLLTTVSIGTLISTICRTQQQAMMASFLFLMPAIMLSGIVFPTDNMPQALQAIVFLDPLKYFITLLRNIMLKGGDSQVVVQNIAALAGITVACMVLAFKRFRLNLS